MYCHSLLPTLCFILSYIRRAELASTGAKASSCASMLPAHAGLQQPHPSPFKVVVTSSTYGCSRNPITVSLISNDVTSGFKGFLCQPRTDINKYQTYGTLQGLQGITTNNCDEAAITHTEPSQKFSVRFLWTPPVEDVGIVYITCTFVKNWTIFWYQITSEGMHYARSCSRHSTTSTVTSSTPNVTESSSTSSTDSSNATTSSEEPWNTTSSSLSSSTSSSTASTVSSSTTYSSFETTVSSAASTAYTVSSLNMICAIITAILILIQRGVFMAIHYPQT